MNVTFLGAVKTVTGSCTLLEAAGLKILVDCGMYTSEKDEKLNDEELPFAPEDIDYILLTHAHIDHSGLIPKLFKDGCQARVICTRPTKRLCNLILPDAGDLQSKRKSIRNEEGILIPVMPMYDRSDAKACLKYFTDCEYDRVVKLSENVRVILRNSGHLLGSASMEIFAKENGRQTKLIFSGDIGSNINPILEKQHLFDSADILCIESTYGNRDHDESVNPIEQIKKVYDRMLELKGEGKNSKTLIPALAGGRIQKVDYFIYKFLKEYPEKKYIDIPIYHAYSKLGMGVTRIYDEEMAKHNDYREYLKFRKSIHLNSYDDLTCKLKKKEMSIILAPSGMLQAASSLEAFKRLAHHSENQVIFANFVANNTPGYAALNQKVVEVDGISISVNAYVDQFQNFSDHIGKKGLKEYVGRIKDLQRIFYTHGEEDAIISNRNECAKVTNADGIIPEKGKTYELPYGNNQEIIDDTNCIDLSSSIEAKCTKTRLQNKEARELVDMNKYFEPTPEQLNRYRHIDDELIPYHTENFNVKIGDFNFDL